MGSASFLFKDNEYGGGQKIKALSEVTVETEGEAWVWVIAIWWPAEGTTHVGQEYPTI